MSHSFTLADLLRSIFWFATALGTFTTAEYLGARRIDGISLIAICLCCVLIPVCVGLSIGSVVGRAIGCGTSVVVTGAGIVGIMGISYAIIVALGVVAIGSVALSSAMTSRLNAGPRMQRAAFGAVFILAGVVAGPMIGADNVTMLGFAIFAVGAYLVGRGWFGAQRNGARDMSGSIESGIDNGTDGGILNG